ncbi:MAG: hypothetical protein JWQ28_228 [Pedobacter sp.]|jgi:hypothetical protein|nr:hypothetical protein [Pedobacter sp.]
MKTVYLALLLVVNSFGGLLAQEVQISGTIKDTLGEPVSFASVYLKGTTKGTSANIDGVYTLKVNPGTLTLVFKAIGYKPVEKLISTSESLTADITMTSEAYTLKGVTISASAEDPAYAIMRHVISNRRHHLVEVKEFSCSVYIKGLQKLVGAPKKFFGRDIQKTLDLDTNRKGILYLSESQSNYNYQRPDKIHEVMVSSKVAGRNNAFSFNKASDLNINFYNNMVLENVLSSRGFVSPVADYAFFYYRYKLLGSSIYNGETINKIQVIPRREHDPVFRGIIYITDDSWRILGTELYLTKSTGVNLVDTLNITQQFIKVEKTYMPSNINFKFNGDVFGFKFEGYYLGVYNNYNLHPKFPKSFFNGELLAVPKTVNKKDSLYWANNRPIPLTDEERADYIRKDEIARRKLSKKYLDSMEHVSNNFTIGKLLLSNYSINDRYNKHYLKLDPVLKSLFYNTVEGFGFNYGATYLQELADYKSYTIRPEIRYGFANQTFSANILGTYIYDPQKRANVSLNFGSGIYDLNRYGTMTMISNSINSLFFERNYAKFFQKKFINAGTSRELASGLQASFNLEYAKNVDLVNHTDFKFVEQKDRDFTSNNPLSPAIDRRLFPNYKALTANATITYALGRKYITRPEGKFYQEPKLPTLQLNYRKGIKDALGSDVDYDLLSVELSQQRITEGLLGYTSFMLSAGKFLNNNKVYYPDSKQFRGNNSLTTLPDLRKFQFLDFYAYSTDKQYVEAHFEQNFAGLITNKLPLVRKLKLEEVLGFNYLTQPAKKNYKEFYFGLQRLIFRATYGFAYDGNKKVQQGFRISYGF